MDMETLAQKILAEKRGEIPPGSVTVDELRAALQERRAKYAAGAQTADAPAKAKKQSIQIADDDIQIDL